MYLAEVFVYLRPSIQDPQGVVIENTLKKLGFSSLDRVRTGKYFQLSLSSASEDEARRDAEKMCRDLLSNTVIEDFRVSVRPAS
ncbi:MAG: phosphoribosylformylglycinamidine synthase subunit PurS [Candidatus Wallbacteria bacterium]|nr:phosphoribosylformylglycinamidine synthase subunit PurS [Candidatus Wallbacteria bacterium]